MALGVCFLGISYGGTAVAAGASPLVVCGGSLLVFAGSAQFAMLAAESGGAGPLAAALGALALNVRYLPLGVALAGRLQGSRARRTAAAHFLIDESAALAINRDPELADRAYWVSGLLLYLGWNLGCGIGALAGGVVGDPRALGLDAAMPASMLALLAPLIRGQAQTLAAALGAGCALLAVPWTAPGTPVLVAAAGALIAAAAARRAPG